MDRGACMGTTGVKVRAWVVLQGLCDGCGGFMGPTGVVVHAWVLQGLCDVHGSYRGCGACMGRTGVVVHV